MNKPKAITATLKAAALVGAFSLISSSSYAAFALLPSPTGETPGLALPTEPGQTGTVLAFVDSSFSDVTVNPPSPVGGLPLGGTLRTIVVDRGGGLLDFYYQLANTSSTLTDPLDSDLYRLNIDKGFAGSVVEVAQVSSLAGLSAGASGINFGNYLQAGLASAATADRDVTATGDVGFTFPTQPPVPFPGASPANLGSGETSNFLVVRTNATSYQVASAGAAGGFAGNGLSTFAAVPEPGTALFGLAMFGVALTNRRRATKVA